MAVMSKMRDNMPAILVGLAILFIAMIVFEWGMDITGRQGMQYTGNIVGKVNGQEITYQEFEKDLQSSVDQYKTETKTDPDATVMKQIRDQVWQGLVNQILVDQAAKKLGIFVTDQEIVNWVTQNPESLPEPIKRNFEDSTGHLNRQILQEALASNSPQIQQFWSNVQTYLKEQRLQEKLTGRLYAAVRLPEGEIVSNYRQSSEKFNAGYVSFPPPILFPDSSIHISESQMRDYYSSHEDEFRTQATRQLKYVLFPIKPSREDSSEVKTEMDQVNVQAQGGTNFLDLVKEYSETPYNDNFVGHGQMNPAVENAAFSAKVGQIVGPFLASDGYHLVKVIAERNGKNVFVHAAHILIPVNPGPDSVQSYKLADKILREARSGANFAELAREYSQDPGSAQNGGDLGWFGKGMMVKPFEDAAFAAKVGQIVGPVRTQFGLHIIKVLGKDSRELKIADIKMSITPSQQTKDDIKQRAEDFIYIAKKDGFQTAANTIGKQASQTPPFQKGGYVPTVGSNKTLADWAFDGSLGDISQITSLPQGYGVFMISEIKDASVMPFKEVATQIKATLTRDKQYDEAVSYASQLRKKLPAGDSLSALAKLDPRLQYNVTGQFTMTSYIPGIGRDYSFLAEASMLKAGQISPAFKGSASVYVMQLLSKTPFDSTAFKIQRLTIMQQLMQQQKSQIVNDWLLDLKNKAKIVDNRSKIFTDD